MRVVGVAPGVVERTALRSEAYEESLARARHESVDELRGSYKAGIPLAREAQLGEIANVVAFVASRRASYLTGVTLNVSGGKSWL